MERPAVLAGRDIGICVNAQSHGHIAARWRCWWSNAVAHTPRLRDSWASRGSASGNPDVAGWCCVVRHTVSVLGCPDGAESCVRKFRELLFRIGQRSDNNRSHDSVGNRVTAARHSIVASADALAGRPGNRRVVRRRAAVSWRWRQEAVPRRIPWSLRRQGFRRRFAKPLEHFGISIWD
jgi:hypothetical protein